VSAPRGIARLSFHPGFPLDAALPLVDHYADLGISHLAASPILTSRPGLPEGVVDHSAVDPALGGEVALRRLMTALRRRQMGLIVDVVPAFVAVGGTDNPAWLDLVEWGRDSTRAPWFDIDWRGSDSSLRNKLLAPFLDQPYGIALQAGALALGFDATRGSFHVRHRDHAFPICPLDYAQILEASGLPAAARLAEPFSRLSRMRLEPDDVAAAKFRLATLVDNTEARAAIASAIGAFDGRTESGRARLHKLLERQAYRLAWWGTAGDELNWRRHPSGTALAAIRVERPDVFDATHAELLRLYGEGLIDGFVIRQWDLLADPAGYARRLKLKLDGLGARRPRSAPPTPYLVADAVIGAGSEPPAGWDVAGTTGAEAADSLGAILHDSTAGTPLADIWALATGERQRFDDVRAAARRQALRSGFGVELQAVARALHEVALTDITTRDISFAALKRVVQELAVALAVPRTYADSSGLSGGDVLLFEAALAHARRRLSPLDAPVADYLADWLGREAPRSLKDFEQSGAREHAIAAFQQFTAALSQVAVDDTLLYRFGRLVSRNEVGADPATLGLKPEAFHARMAQRAARSRHAPTATSGPAQRRGEDARARLAVISELPRAWDDTLKELMEATRPFRSRLMDGVVPDPADAVILFQTLVGAWPAALKPDDVLGVGELHDRMQAWWQRSIRCARLRTGPMLGNPDYEEGCARFLSSLLEAPAGLPMRRQIAAFAGRLARAGTINALSHLVLKCTVPGVPEFYAGSETWDFRLETAGPAASAARLPVLDTETPLERLLAAHADGRVKTATQALLLKLRGSHAAVFRDGEYIPLPAEGRRADHVVAFIRRHRDSEIVTVATRLSTALIPTALISDRCVPSRAFRSM